MRIHSLLLGDEHGGSRGFRGVGDFFHGLLTTWYDAQRLIIIIRTLINSNLVDEEAGSDRESHCELLFYVSSLIINADSPWKNLLKDAVMRGGGCRPLHRWKLPSLPHEALVNHHACSIIVKRLFSILDLNNDGGVDRE